MIESLPPIIGRAPRVLILGSMPGPESLRLEQYYAHPQNAFWPILFEITGRPFSPDYAHRRALIETGPFILWDVLQSCERKGALDSDIRKATPNDIPGLIKAHPTIEIAALNGGKAAAEFARMRTGLVAVRLPSTSPAYAGMRKARKAELWREALEKYI